MSAHALALNTGSDIFDKARGNEIVQNLDFLATRPDTINRAKSPDNLPPQQESVILESEEEELRYEGKALKLLASPSILLSPFISTPKFVSIRPFISVQSASDALLHRLGSTSYTILFQVFRI